MSLTHDGHLTHGAKVNFSGKLYNSVQYGLKEQTGEIDYDELERLALVHRPRMIVAGFSAYSRFMDWRRFRAVADSVSAILFVDMAHVAGLVAPGVYLSPVGIADVVSSTTHKSLRGPRGGFILANSDPAVWICDVMDDPENDDTIARVRSRSKELCERFPVYSD